MPEIPHEITELARTAERVCVLTGAGMSAESGVATFRDVATGLWSKFSQSDLATPEAWEENPGRVWAWYSWRATMIGRSEPNAGHRALAEWQQRVDLDIVTQNVDNLHERAGADVLVHVHGDIFALRCSRCDAPPDATYPTLDEPVEHIEPPRCAACDGYVRPGVVWFGEMLPDGAMEKGAEAVRTANLVLVVGTSGMVYPAALLPEIAAEAGIPVVEINPEPTPASHHYAYTWQTTAATGLPALLDHAHS